ncbi:hypothetical protein RRG08_038581 [Elysia crispata]|uniref:Uncharacterized protein n=1 Tax=Elysia crispata TaxID=231223 RepID=A0AAE1ATI2_9GAST|nr:hypothetical protein RRG08_038581 [Elysia crispata]
MVPVAAEAGRRSLSRVKQKIEQLVTPTRDSNINVKNDTAWAREGPQQLPSVMLWLELGRAGFKQFVLCLRTSPFLKFSNSKNIFIRQRAIRPHNQSIS